MSQHVWRIWRLAWMRRDCIPYSGKIDGWMRIVSRLFWCSGYSREWEIHCAFRQGFIEGSQHGLDLNLDRLGALSEQRATYYTESIAR